MLVFCLQLFTYIHNLGFLLDSGFPVFDLLAVIDFGVLVFDLHAVGFSCSRRCFEQWLSSALKRQPE